MQFINHNLKYSYIFILSLICISITGCKKMVTIDEPVNSITTSKVFSSEATATAAVIALYSKMINSDLTYSNGALTIFNGLSADELKINGGGLPAYVEFQRNSLQPNNGFVLGPFWRDPYFIIYQANAAIEGLQASINVSDSVKNQLIGEAKFIRAFSYFYLVNLFGDVPLVVTSGWINTATIKRTPVNLIYDQMISDLNDAQNLLRSNYITTGMERVRANKWAATALLARVYLYNGEWAKAEEQATAIINNSTQYSLVGNLNNVFLKNSQEAILQLQVNRSVWPYATTEGNNLIPMLLTKNFTPAYVAQYWKYFVPEYYLSNEILNAFELDDQRKIKWADSTGLLNGVNYYYCYKYKVSQGTSGNVTEYYMLFRLAEQYLIRAEARAKQNKLDGSLSDLNIIRTRAGLPNLSLLNQTQALAAVAQENRIEFFAELGHRWLDLKRTGQPDAVLKDIKGADWQTTDQLFPIPLSEIQTNTELIQNLGY